MALSSFVYISNVDNLSDARYAAGMGVDLIGFKLDPNDEKSLWLDQFKEISEWISGMKIVGEFGNASPEKIREVLDDFSVDYLLVTDETLIQNYALLGVPLILNINLEKVTDLESTLNYCSGVAEYFLLTSANDKINTDEIETVKAVSDIYPLILGYGINPENAKSIVDELHLKGIALKGSPELRPGYKDFDEMADILEELEVD